MTTGTTSIAMAIVAGAAALALVLAGCGGSGDQGAGDRQAVFTEADNGQTVKVKTGDVIKVQLAENPSTGYLWQGSLTTGLQLLGSEYTPDDPSGEQTGSGGVRTWTMQIEQTGEHRFLASYLPPGKMSGDPERYMLTMQTE